MKRKSLITIGCAALAATVLGAAACAAEVHQEGHGSPDKAYRFLSYRVDEKLDELEASDAQRDKVHAIKDRLFEKAMTARKEGRESRKAALVELKGDKPDAKKLHALVDERIEAFRGVGHDAVDAVVELHGVLTPEQRAELLADLEERMAAHEEE